MTAIRILPEILSNKIAAGEVIERPASVVKELVENSLDAGSSRIMIDIENGGRTLIQISDNGCGMIRDDALLSVERYATSKIHTDEDLFSIKTLGFRGEALPSIASVSRFTLETRHSESDAGIRIEMEGGKIKSVSEVGAPVGTLVTVKNLFFNVPARRKFLKTVSTETGRIADTVASIALGRHQVQFRLRHNGKTVRDWNAAPDLTDRVTDVLGSDIRHDLLLIDADKDAVSLRGWIVSQNITRTTSRNIYVYVNGRFVRDSIIRHALIGGFGGRLMKGQFPMAVIFLQTDPDRVDVNVHPAKQEIRFSEPQHVHDIVMTTVSAALNRYDLKKWRGKTDIPETKIQETNLGFEEQTPDIPGSGNRSETVPVSEPIEKKRSDQQPLWTQKTLFSDARIIGQAFGTYILCDTEDGLVVIDQHAAHERILYEKLQTTASTPQSQQLLVPETIEAGFAGAGLLEKLAGHFRHAGLDIEPFGGSTFIVKAVPPWLSSGNIKPVIHDIIEKIQEIGVRSDVTRATDECLKVMACHGAIRAGQMLSANEIRELLRQLDDCEFPSHCPHGRPTWIRWSLQFLEKTFKRIV